MKLKALLVAASLVLAGFATQYSFAHKRGEAAEYQQAMSGEWLAALEQQLQLSPDQQGAWDNYVQVTQQQQADQLSARANFDRKAFKKMDEQQRLEVMRTSFDSRIEGMTASIAARNQLLDALDGEQRQLAEVALPKPNASGMLKVGAMGDQDCHSKRGKRGWWH